MTLCPVCWLYCYSAKIRQTLTTNRTHFRYFLSSLRQYFEYYVAFVRCDTNSDHKISLQEFKDAQEKIELWVGKIDAEASFNEIDTNKGTNFRNKWNPFWQFEIKYELYA